MMKGILENEFTVCDVTPRSGTIRRAANFHFCHKSIYSKYTVKCSMQAYINFHFVSVSDWAQFFQRNVHLLKFYGISLYVLKKIKKVDRNHVCLFTCLYDFSMIKQINNDSESDFFVLISNLILIPIIYVYSYIYL